jgi:hypothetical protein
MTSRRGSKRGELRVPSDRADALELLREEASPDAVAALERCWEVARSLAPTMKRLLDAMGKPQGWKSRAWAASAPGTEAFATASGDIDGTKATDHLLGPISDPAVRDIAAHAVWNVGLLLLQRRGDVAATLVPFLWEICCFALKLAPVTERAFALSEYLWRGTTASAPNELTWAQRRDMWRKRKTGIKGRRAAPREPPAVHAQAPDDDEISVEWLRDWLQRKLRKQAQRP